MSVENAATTMVHGKYRNAVAQNIRGVSVNSASERQWSLTITGHNRLVGSLPDTNHDPRPYNFNERLEKARTAIAIPLWIHRSLIAAFLQTENCISAEECV